MITTRIVREVNHKLEETLASLGRPTSPELVAAARVLRKEIRRTLGKKGEAVQGPVRPGQHALRRAPSRPGEPPAKQTGKLQQSVKSGVVGAAQRVAVTRFTAPLLEFGVDTRADGAAPRSRRDLFTRDTKSILGDSLKAFSRKLARRRGDARRTSGRGSGNRPGARGKVRHMVLEPRPFMERSLAAARGAMVDVVVSEIRRRTPATS